MKKAILSLAVAEIIIGCSMQSNVQAATIENTNGTNDNITEISALQKSGKVILIGSKGKVVECIQRLLNSLEGYNIQEDGIFGVETYNAVIKYQAKNGLKQDGIIGKQTAAKLLSVNEKSKANIVNKKIESKEELDTAKIENRSEIDTVKAKNEIIEFELSSKDINTDTNYFIVVSKSQRQVYIYYKEIDSWIKMNVFSCNIGDPSTPTIEGDFYSGLKGKELRISDTYVKYFTQINGEYLFHSDLYSEAGEVIDDCLNHEIPRGCVSLALEDAKYIHDTIPLRTGIKIIE